MERDGKARGVEESPKTTDLAIKQLALKPSTNVEAVKGPKRVLQPPKAVQALVEKEVLAIQQASRQALTGEATQTRRDQVIVDGTVVTKAAVVAPKSSVSAGVKLSTVTAAQINAAGSSNVGPPVPGTGRALQFQPRRGFKEMLEKLEVHNKVERKGTQQRHAMRTTGLNTIKEHPKFNGPKTAAGLQNVNVWQDTLMVGSGSDIGNGWRSAQGPRKAWGGPGQHFQIAAPGETQQQQGKKAQHGKSLGDNVQNAKRQEAPVARVASVRCDGPLTEVSMQSWQFEVSQDTKAAFVYSGDINGT